MNNVFSLLWNIWMQREFVGIDNADFNEKLVQGFVSYWSTSTVVCIGILTQLTFEGIWIGSNRSPTTVIERRLERSVPKSVESGTTSQEGIIEVGQNNRGLCWHCFYLQKITFLTKPYRIWLRLTLKINRILTAAKGIESKEFPEISLRIVAADLIVEWICWGSDLLTREASVLAVLFVNLFLWGMIESV